MKKILSHLSFLLLISSATAQTNIPVVQFGRQLSVHSRILNEDRPCWVYEPPSYNSDASHAPQRYPVLFVLDGETHFQWVCGVVQYLSGFGSMQIPELLVVGVCNTSTNRIRDLSPTHSMKNRDGKEDPTYAASGGAGAFLDFLEQELIPQIEARYRTVPYRILAGHSMGGLLTMDALVRRPGLFQGYIAMDPSIWWDSGSILSTARKTLPKAQDLRGAVYISLAHSARIGAAGPKHGDAATMDFAEIIETNKVADLRNRFQYFESEEHNSVPVPSVHNGLRFIFDGYRPGDPETVTAAAIAEHFKSVSRRVGYEILPPEDYMNRLGGYLLFTRHDTNGAIDCLKLNVKNYPAAANVYDSLGEAYALQGKNELAILNYEKALELYPDMNSSREALKKLKRP